jgi:hypothetical protein
MNRWDIIIMIPNKYQKKSPQGLLVVAHEALLEIPGHHVAGTILGISW